MRKSEVMQALIDCWILSSSINPRRPGEVVKKLIRNPEIQKAIASMTAEDFNHPMEIKKWIGETKTEQEKREFREWIEKRGNML